MNRTAIKTLSALALLVPVACADVDNDSGPLLEDRSASLDLLLVGRDLTDVAGFNVTVTRVACPGAELIDPYESTEFVELEDQLIPGNLPELMNNPLDEDSAHLFADRFLVVAAGCYDVMVDPVTDDGSASADCLPAWKKNVEVRESETTEIFLLSQCLGDDNGALDAIAALNHEPSIDNLTIEDSKFAAVCEPVTLCATASDPDMDPLEFEWSTVDGDPLHDSFSILSTTDNGDGTITQCVTVDAKVAGSRTLRVTVYDLMHDAGSIVRVEDWLASAGYPSESRSVLDFPLHVVDSVWDALAPLTEWSVRQGGSELGVVSAYSAAYSTPDMYSYNNPAGSSYNGVVATGGAVPDSVSGLSQLFLYRPDGLDATSLVAVHDRPNDGSGGEIVFDVSGLGNGALVEVADDPGPAGEGGAMLPGDGTANFHWNWAPCCTDGIALGDISWEECVEITPDFRSGIDRWVVQNASGEMVELDPTQPVELCPVQCVPGLDGDIAPH